MRAVPLGRLFDRIDVRGRTDLPLLGVSVAHGVRPRWADDGRPAASLDLSTYKLVEPGDIIMNALGKPHGSIGRASTWGITSPAYWVLRSRKDIESTYAHHLLRSSWAVSQYKGLGKYLPPNQFDISWEVFGGIHVDLPTPSEQRRIADFLDERVALIDRIIEARWAQVSSFSPLLWSGFQAAIEGSPYAPLRRAIARISDGPFGSAFSSRDYSESGAAVVRLGNIGFNEFKASDLVRIPFTIYDKFPASRIDAGNLLIASLGDANNHAGRACVAPEYLGPAMAKGKTFVAFADHGVASEKYLAAFLSSPAGAERLNTEGAGATRVMLNFDRLLSTRVALPAKDVQDFALNSLSSDKAKVESLTNAVRRSITLLTEYKQSLITAAVTGEFDVTTASTRMPHNLGGMT